MKVEAATLPDDLRNQDAHGWTSNAAVVLDGASAFMPDPHDRNGGWYARSLLQQLLVRLTEATDQPLSLLLRDSIDALRREHDLRPGGPSCTVVIARQLEQMTDFLVLGDSTAVFQTINGDVRALTDDRLGQVATQQRSAYRQRLSSGAGFDAEHRRLLAELQDAQALARNKDGGYWIAEADPAAAENALVTRGEHVEMAALLTDGAARLVELYRQPPTWPQYLEELDSSGPYELIRRVSELDDSDPTGRRWPRAKRADDRTLLVGRP